MVQNYIPHIGGVEKHVENLCAELLSDQHKVTIYVVKHQNNYKSYEKTGDFEIVRFDKKRNKFLTRLAVCKHVLFNLPQILRNDIIHFHDFTTFYLYGFVLYPFIFIFRKKAYITFHGWEGHVPPSKKTIYLRKLAEKLCRANLCVGNYIEKWYGTHADVITYGGVSPHDDVYETDRDVVFVGRLEPDTGIVEYIEAWLTIGSELPEQNLTVLGDGTLRRQLEKKIEDSGLSNVVFKGFVSNPDDYIKEAKVVLTSGYLAMLEAFAMKKNVVAVYSNDLKKDYLTMIPGYGSMIWVANNSENLAKYIHEALKDNVKRNAAYRFATDNSWKKVKKDYYKLWSM